MAIQATGHLTPLVATGQNAVVNAVFGGSISSAVFQRPPASQMSRADVLASTYLALNIHGRVNIYDFGTGDLSPIGPLSPAVPYFQTTPSISAVGEKIAFLGYDSNAVVQIFTMQPDGTQLTQVTTGTVTPSAPAISPDGTKIAFVRHTGQNESPVIYVVRSTGGTPSALTASSDRCVNPAWSPDGTKLAYFKWTVVQQVVGYQPWTMNVDASGQTAVPYGLLSLDPGNAAGISICWMPNGTFLQSGTTIFQGQSGIQGYVQQFGNFQSLLQTTQPNQLSNVTLAPTADTAAFAPGYPNRGSVALLDLVTQGVTPLPPAADYVAWGPYIQYRPLVGNQGSMGTTASAVMFGETLGGSSVARLSSVLTATATTPSSLTITQAPNPNNAAILVFTVKATSITALSYLNVLGGTPFSVLGTSTATGAIVSFSANSGKIVSVMPYKSPSAVPLGSGRYKADFLGIWDDHGKNMAPSGASEINMEPSSGKVHVIR